MAVTPSLGVIAKTKRKILGKQSTSSHPAAARKVMPSPPEIGVSSEQPAAFDPRPFLAKLGVGKSKQKYQEDEAVFSQGDAADAVFYVQNGKVKLTAVSTQGKEAVVAILPEGSFFGEGCLAGQTLRMSTASAFERSTIIRVEKASNGGFAPSGTRICRTLSRLSAHPERSHGSGLGRSSVQLQRKTPRPASPANGQLWSGIKADPAHRENKPRDPCRNDRYNPLASQFLYESVQGPGLYRLQR